MRLNYCFSETAEWNRSKTLANQHQMDISASKHLILIWERKREIERERGEKIYWRQRRKLRKFTNLPY